MSQSERVVVIGGAGFIGKRLTALLANAGLPCGGRESLVGQLATAPILGLNISPGAITDRARMSELIAGASVVYDLAMPVGLVWEDWEREVIAGGINRGRSLSRESRYAA